MNRNHLSLALAVLGTLSSAPVLAGEYTGWVYNGFTGLGSISQGDLSDDSLGSAPNIGYRWGWLGVELGYNYFGKFTDEAMVGSVPVDIDANVDGWNAGINLNHDLSERWSLQGRVGLFDWKTDGHVDDGVNRLAYSDSGNDWYAGASIDYRLSKRTSLGLGYVRYSLNDADINLWGMHSEFRF